MVFMRHLGSILATLMLIVASCSSALAEEPETLKATLTKGSVAEVMVDFGDVPYSKCVTKSIIIENDTDAPIVLLDYDTTCRCTWLTLPKTAIAPKKSAEVTITFDSRGEWGSVGNFLSIETANKSCKVAVWMSADIVR